MIRRVNCISWPLRWTLKVAFAVLVTLVVLFPRLDRVPITFRRHLDPNALIQPEAPELQPMIAEFDERRESEWDDQRMLNEIQRFVHKKVPYEWDWNIWGNADYFPTISEVLEVKQEDCDGRAIVAASMLRHYGYNARLVTDIKHLWVETDRGATMGPGKVKAVTFSDDQDHEFNWKILAELPGAFSMGVAVFPLERELILTVLLWILLLGRQARLRRAFVWLAVLGVGLMLIREGGHPRLGDDAVKQWAGLTVIVFAVVGLVFQQRRAAFGAAEDAAGAAEDENGS